MLVIVPARGGSKGVPRKNLRAVDGEPLVLRTLNLAREALGSQGARIVCSTDDPTIAAIARLHGFEVHDRDPKAATDESTVQEVAWDVCTDLEWEGMTIVLQPTAATLTADTLREAVDTMIMCEEYDSLSTVTANRHMTRTNVGAPIGDFVNRQEREPLWTETGGIQIARTMPAKGSHPYVPLVGEWHYLCEITEDEALDIDRIEDLHTARLAASKRRICFVVVASDRLGSGHLRRCLSLAQELDHHDIQFDYTLADGQPPDWVIEEVEAAGYDCADAIPKLRTHPDLVVFDCLDTTPAMVSSVKAGGSKVICLEDLGEGAAEADLVVNELYDVGHLVGPKYAVLRPEFMALPPFGVRTEPREILVTFGGTDPSKLADRVLAALAPIGVPVHLVHSTDVMVEAMTGADLLVSSCGRTVHEAAAVGLPTVAIAANSREERHSHCPGVIHLGLHATLSDEQIARTVQTVAFDQALRLEMSTTMRDAVDGKGARRIAWLIEGLLEGL